MKSLFSRTNLTWFFLAAIICGAIFIIWVLASGDAPPANAVLIDGAGTGRVGNSALGLPASSLGDQSPTATPYTIKLENGKDTDPSRAQNSILNARTPTPGTVTVYVSGAVAQPGVYTLPEGARVQDAIAAAGGAMIEADLDTINLAQKLVDEAHITIGRRDEGTSSSVQQPATSEGTLGSAPAAGQSISQPAAAKPTPDALININTANAAELETLPGVGPSLAARIITDREQNGPYSSVEDLMRVSGIKDGILSKIRAYITVGP